MKTGFPSGCLGLVSAWLCLAAVLQVPRGAWAQSNRAPVPDLYPSWSSGSADSLVLQVRVSLPAGWYINSHAPLDSFLVPTRIEAAVLDAAPGTGGSLAFGPPRWPAPVVEHSQAMAGDMSLFKESFQVAMTANPPGTGNRKGPVPKPPAATRVTLHYQSCDGTMCWPPKSVSVVLRDGRRMQE